MAGTTGTNDTAATETARPAVERVSAGAHRVLDKLASVASKAAETLDVKGGQWKDAQSRFAEDCRVQVRERPLTALGIALAAGIVLGMILNRR
ncbi:MAG: glycine zipper domain-containing protein [Steroidobacteraceae bacterium]